METLNERLREFYRGKMVAHDSVWPMHLALYKAILAYRPLSVFEFGAGTGKNLKHLRGADSDLIVRGVDLNAAAIAKSEGLVKMGTEDDEWGDADVAFTCSVLDHIPEPEAAITRLQRTAPVVLIAEAIRAPTGHFEWYVHPYGKWGFERVDGVAYERSGVTYAIWGWPLH